MNKNVTLTWHDTLDKLQETLRSFEFENGRARQEITRKEAYIQTLLKGNRERMKKTPTQPNETPTVTYKLGQKFQYIDPNGNKSKELYFLAQIEFSRVSLIGLTSANRWTDALTVADTSKISKLDFDTHYVGPNALEWVPVP